MPTSSEGNGGQSRVLITGASSGIGLATALRFAWRGAAVAIAARNDAGLAKAQRAIREAGGKAIAVQADVSNRADLEGAVGRAVAELGGLDIAVANVGAAAYGPFAETGADDFDRVIDVTFRGNVNTIRAVLPHLEATAGSLIVTGSASADFPLPLMSAYTAAKHATRGFLDALRIELRSEGSSVSVTLVEPGPIDTPFWENVASQNGRLPPKIPLPYAPEEVARAIERSIVSRAPRVTVGGFTGMLRTVHRLARPLSERALARVAAFANTAGEPRLGAAAIWNPSGAGNLRAGLGGRPSLLVRGLGLISNLASRLPVVGPR